MAFEDDDPLPYAVIVNDENQHSLWPARKSVPTGWRATGFTGSKAQCVSQVDATWTDLRPASLQASMAEA